MKHMLHSNKRGISEIVSYVLLILLVLAIAALIIPWMKSLIPENEKECPDVSIMIKDYNCSNNIISVEIANNGRFNIDGWYARVYDENGEAKTLKDNSNIKTEQNLNVSLSAIKEYIYEGNIKSVEIQPFIEDGGEILCDKAIIKQDVDC